MLCGQPDRYYKNSKFAPSPAQVPGVADATGIAFIGDDGAMALGKSGSVQAWGAYGVCPPGKFGGLDGVTSIESKGNSALALKSDGTVWGWGANESGQLGDGTTTHPTQPVQVRGLAGVTSIQFNGVSALALKSDGTVWGWGLNAGGVLGDGTTTQRNTPVQVSALTAAVSIHLGSSTSYAMKSDGTVWAWGANGNGELGNGTKWNYGDAPQATPVQISGLTDVKGIYTAKYNGASVYALKNDGTVWAWGANRNGELGDGTTNTRTAPVQVKGLAGVTDVTVWDRPDLGNDNSVYAVKADGTAWVWGSGASTASQVLGISGIKRVIAYGGTSFAIKTDGTLWGWGSNAAGQLGDGSTTNRAAPAQVPGLYDVAEVIINGFDEFPDYPDTQVLAVAASMTPTSTTPKISDTTPVTAQRLTVQPGRGQVGRLSYRWYRKSPSGKVRLIKGATGASYAVRASDVRYRLRVKVTATSQSKSISKYSSWTSKVAKAKFTAAPTPSVNGVAQVGGRLAAAPGAWEPSPKLRYQWYRVSASGKRSAIHKATKANYTPTSQDEGRQLQVRVKAYRSGFVTTTRYSTVTGKTLPR